MSKTKEELLEGVQVPASRSPRDYNLILIAMDEYAAQRVAEYKEKLKGMIHGRSVIRPSQVIQLIDEV
jgi:hypothetical protein